MAPYALRKSLALAYLKLNMVQSSARYEIASRGHQTCDSSAGRHFLQLLIGGPLSGTASGLRDSPFCEWRPIASRRFHRRHSNGCLWPNASVCAPQQLVCNHALSRHFMDDEQPTLLTLSGLAAKRRLW